MSYSKHLYQLIQVYLQFVSHRISIIWRFYLMYPMQMQVNVYNQMIPCPQIALLLRKHAKEVLKHFQGLENGTVTSTTSRDQHLLLDDIMEMVQICRTD